MVYSSEDDVVRDALERLRRHTPTTPTSRGMTEAEFKQHLLKSGRISSLPTPADRTPLPDGSVDLVTVATAFHWLDFPRFYGEVRRVAKPDGILACWGYKVLSVTPEVDAVIQRLDAEVLRHFWLPETRLAVEGYRTIPFPFDEIATPPFRMTHEWNLDQLTGFLGTWSASNRYRTQTGRESTDEIRGGSSPVLWSGRSPPCPR